MFGPRSDQAQAKRFRELGWWRDETIFNVLRARASAHPDRLLFTDARSRITYANFQEKVERCAEFFHRIGIGREDVVTIQLPNRIEFLIVVCALELVGAIANKVNPDFRMRELEYILKFSRSRALVIPREFKGFDYVGMAKALQASNSAVTHLIVAGGKAESAFDLDEGLRASPPMAETVRVAMNPDEVYRMAFTSGTTGDPKCVLHSFNTTLSTIHQINRDMEVTQDDVLLIYLPVGLNWGYLTLLQTIMAGARAVLMEQFSAKPSLAAIQAERITYIPTAPASLVAMLNVPDFGSYDLSSLRVVISGGASASVETIRAYQQRIKGNLLDLYGMLETGFHSYTRLSDDPTKVNGTVGRVVDCMDLRLVDGAGQDVAFGEIGEILARGPSVHLGYYNNSSANEQAFTDDGWFRTGDLARFVDEQSNVRITGRSKEIINRGGKKFFPREVEELLYGHPKILHAAMVGIADHRLGERNCLCVVPKGGCHLELDEMVGFLKGQVADYKLPEVIHEIDELPLTATGKVRRSILREIVEAARRSST
ncbi:MAG: acyl-CoA synthetase [Hyphomicrobiales bacterium]|jgi:non-ribosomal peptide synthetase component E (peptide arylation enzyme)|nr:acyl-CoA synthetase [Hyphomicrobiales bacterium]